MCCRHWLDVNKLNMTLQAGFFAWQQAKQTKLSARAHRDEKL